MNFDKMKVVDLRALLQARGLDTKGVKATLIDRLKEAMELEASGEEPVQSSIPPTTQEPTVVDATPKRRSSRSRTKSPEPVPTTKAPDPVLPPVTEESEAMDEQQNYEKIIDETNADDEEAHDDLNEDELLAEPEDSSAPVPATSQNTDEEMKESQQNEEAKEGEEKMETDGENRGTKRRSDSPTKGNSPKKRQRLPPPNIDDFVNDEDEPELNESSVVLSWFDSDLNLKIDRETFCSAQSLSETGLALVWAGARSNYGIVKNGKYFFEVQLVSFNTKINYPHERNLHEIRCGWSIPTTNLQLGEQENSFGLDSSGKKCHNSTFEEYGSQLRVDDVVGVHLDLNDDQSSVRFTINGKDFGVAYEFEKSSLNGEALFPHISTKNIEYRVNFGQIEESLWSSSRDKFKENELKRRRDDLGRKKRELERKIEEKAKKDAENAAAEAAKATSTATSTTEETTPATENSEENKETTSEEQTEQKQEVTPTSAAVEEKKDEPSLEDQLAAIPEDISESEIDQEFPSANCLNGFLYVNKYPIGDLIRGPQRPEARTDCEVIMMIGLPGSGKSNWATKHAAENPEKRYTLLGTKYLLERMKIQGVARKPGSGPGRWEKLIELCNRGLLTLNDIACKRRRNFILDQPHVYISDQRRKMRVYGDFKRIAVIVVPNEEEYKKRTKLRLETEGKDIPEAAVNEMRANLTLPELEYQWFNEIIYTDLEKEAAQAEVNRENERGKKALSQRNRHNDYNRGGRDFNQRNDRRWGNNNGGGRNDRNDFRRNDRWGPRNQMAMGSGGNGGGGGGYRRDFDFNRRGGNWNRPDNWQNNSRQGGYGGAPPPRPGKQRQNDNRNQQSGRNNRNFRPNQQGGNNRNRDRRPDGNKKFGGNKDWNSQGGNQWGNSGGNWNNYGGGNQGYNQWNQNQAYGGSNTDDQNQQNWMAYYQQQQQANSASWYSDQNYGGAFSSNTSYDSNQTKQ